MFLCVFCDITIYGILIRERFNNEKINGDVWFSCKLRILLRHLLEEAFRHTCPDHFTSCLKLHRFEEKDSQRLSLLSRASDGHCSRPNLRHLLASYPCRSCLRGGTSVSYSLPPSTWSGPLPGGSLVVITLGTAG